MSVIAELPYLLIPYITLFPDIEVVILPDLMVGTYVPTYAGVNVT